MASSLPAPLHLMIEQSKQKSIGESCARSSDYTESCNGCYRGSQGLLSGKNKRLGKRLRTVINERFGCAGRWLSGGRESWWRFARSLHSGRRAFLVLLVSHTYWNYLLCERFYRNLSFPLLVIWNVTDMKFTVIFYQFTCSLLMKFLVIVIQVDYNDWIKTLCILFLC